MGCASSKRIEAAVDYRPAPASFTVFDINAIREPWLMLDNTTPLQEHHDEKPPQVPAQILDKLNLFEAEATAAPPHSWDEVSKALEDLKPSPKQPPLHVSPAHNEPRAQNSPRKPRKSVSFHTVEELDAKLTPKPAELKKSESMRSESRVELPPLEAQAQSTVGYIKPVKENIFIMRDRLEREREGKVASFDRIISKRDPLSDYPEKCPPGGTDSVVVYTTSLRGVRRTFEDCCKVKSVLDGHMLVYDERDVALHGEFLTELKGLVGEGLGVPRVFVKGRYVGGVEEVVELNESGGLGRMVKWARVERRIGWQACEGCGGARFVPCLECGGSCKVVSGDKKERCPKCNENGLVHCAACWALT